MNNTPSPTTPLRTGVLHVNLWRKGTFSLNCYLMLREGVNEASKKCIQLGPTLHFNLLFNPLAMWLVDIKFIFY